MSDFENFELGDLIEFQRGYDLPKSEFQEGNVPVISSNGILGYHNEVKSKAPGITIGRSGTVGLPQFINKDFFPHNTSLFVKDFKGNNVFYIFYLLKSLKLNEYKSGSGVPTMNRNHLHPIKILGTKSIFKQQKIASILSSLDDKIEINNKLNDNLERMAKTLYDYWFVQFDFPDENGKPYKSSGGKMVWNEILKREIPIDWEFQTIEELGTITGGSTPSKAIEDNFSKNGIPWITPKDLSQNIGNKFITRGEFDVTKKGLKEASLNILPANSVLMSSRAPIGYLAINRFNCATNQGFKSIVCNKEYPFEYVFYVLKHNMLSIEANASGSTFKEISTAVLKTIKILKPQKRLVNQFKNIASVLFQQQNNLEQQNQQLSSLRDWLLPMMMNGQVKVE